jgi:hypothetical protein
MAWRWFSEMKIAVLFHFHTQIAEQILKIEIHPGEK